MPLKLFTGLEAVSIAQDRGLLVHLDATDHEPSRADLQPLQARKLAGSHPARIWIEAEQPLYMDAVTDAMVAQVRDQATAAGELELAATAARALDASSWELYNLTPEAHARVKALSVRAAKSRILAFLNGQGEP